MITLLAYPTPGTKDEFTITINGFELGNLRTGPDQRYYFFPHELFYSHSFDALVFQSLAILVVTKLNQLNGDDKPNQPEERQHYECN